MFGLKRKENYAIFFLTAFDNVIIPSYTDCLGDAEIRITVCLSIFNGIKRNHNKKLRVYMVLESCLKIRDTCIEFDPLIQLTWFHFALKASNLGK